MISEVLRSFFGSSYIQLNQFLDNVAMEDEDLNWLVRSIAMAPVAPAAPDHEAKG